MKVEIIGKSTLEDKAILDLSNTIAEFFSIEDDNSMLEILFLEPEEIRKLNLTYRKIDKATDVLSFPQISVNSGAPVLGSIVICEQVSAEMGESVQAVLTHGMMHLSGLDHETNWEEWNKMERKLYAKIGL